MELSSETAAKKEKEWMPCQHCGGETKHTLVFAGMIMEHEPDMSPSGLFATWLVWQCDGCEFMLLEDTLANWVDGVFEERADYDLSAFYPGIAMRPIRPFLKLPERLKQIYGEVISAYNNRLDTLCTSGLRSLIEGICDDKEIGSEQDAINKKIDSLVKLGLSPNIVKNLHSFRFMGNDAIHRLKPPKRDDLGLAIDLLEDLLNYVYDLDYKASELGARQNRKLQFLQKDKLSGAEEGE